MTVFTILISIKVPILFPLTTQHRMQLDHPKQTHQTNPKQQPNRTHHQPEPIHNHPIKRKHTHNQNPTPPRTQHPETNSKAQDPKPNPQPLTQKGTTPHKQCKVVPYPISSQDGYIINTTLSPLLIATFSHFGCNTINFYYAINNWVLTRLIFNLKLD